jgi:hypothetical protein
MRPRLTLTFLFLTPPLSVQGYTAIVGRRFAQAFQEYKPNLIISVHPLMQHVPVGGGDTLLFLYCLRKDIQRMRPFNSC